MVEVSANAEVLEQGANFLGIAYRIGIGPEEFHQSEHERDECEQEPKVVDVVAFLLRGVLVVEHVVDRQREDHARRDHRRKPGVGESALGPPDADPAAHEGDEEPHRVEPLGHPGDGSGACSLPVVGPGARPPPLPGRRSGLLDLDREGIPVQIDSCHSICPPCSWTSSVHQ